MPTTRNTEQSTKRMTSNVPSFHGYRKPGNTFYHSAGFIENVHKTADNQDKQNDVNAVNNPFDGRLNYFNKALRVSFLILKGARNRDWFADFACGEFLNRNANSQAIQCFLGKGQVCRSGWRGHDEGLAGIERQFAVLSCRQQPSADCS